MLVVPEAGHVDVLVPVGGPGHHQRADGVDHRHGVSLDVIIRPGLDGALLHAVFLPPLGQVTLFQRTDEQIPQPVGGLVPVLAPVQPRGGGNGGHVVGIHGAVVGLDAGDTVLLGNGIEQASEVGAHHGVRTLAGAQQIPQQHRRDIPDGFLKLGEVAHPHSAGLHQVGHQLLHIPRHREKLQPRLPDHALKGREGGHGNFMAALLQFLPQQHIRPHIACGTNAQHRDIHASPPFLSVRSAARSAEASRAHTRQNRVHTTSFRLILTFFTQFVKSAG